MLVTFAVFHGLRSISVSLLQSENREYMEVTLSVFQLLILGLLRMKQSLNKPDIFVTLDVFHELRSRAARL